MKNDARLDLRLPTELKQRIEMAAEGRSINAWVRDACERKMDPYRGPEDETPRVAKKLEPLTVPTGGKATKPVVEEVPLPKIAPRRWGK